MERISKALSYLLRHHPEEFNVYLQHGGWADITTVVQGLRTQYPEFNETQLQEIVNTDEKHRYEIQGNLVRAVQGHSTPVTMDYTPSLPPSQLFHGTTTRVVPSIRSQGLIALTRQYVHLSPSYETAEQVAKRRKQGVSIILTIETQAAVEKGIVFYEAPNGVWLTVYLPTEFIRFPEL